MFRKFAKGSRCFSFGFLALGLNGLMQPEAVHRITTPLLPAPPAVAEPAAVSQTPPPAIQQTPAQQTPATTPTTAAPAPPVPAPPVPVAPAPAPAAPVQPDIASLLPLDFEEHGAPESPYGSLIYEMAGRYAVNPYLVAAVVQVESAFNPRALSNKGARGLMQLLPETARRFGLQRKKDLFDPAKNLEAGIRYLKWLSERFSGDAARVLAAYNAGEGAVERFGGVPPYQETRNYVTRIFGLLGLVPPADAPAELSGDAAAGR
jgi:soluble lytic murein transglycosylase-like protein